MTAYKIVLQKQHGKREDPLRHRRVVIVVAKSLSTACARAIVDADSKRVLLDRTVGTKEGNFIPGVVKVELADLEVLSP